MRKSTLDNIKKQLKNVLKSEKKKVESDKEHTSYTDYLSLESSIKNTIYQLESIYKRDKE